jgi:hypothetical protein
MEPVFQSPFQKISALSQRELPLLLRLRDNRDRWLRVHEDGSLEVATGDHRQDSSCVELAPLSAALLSRARALHENLRVNFRPDDLDRASRWDHFYPVQAFSGPNSPIIEGYVGIEIDMGAMTDVFGFRSGTDGYPSVYTLRELLDLIPRR